MRQSLAVLLGSIWLGSAAGAQTFHVEPLIALQGETLRVKSTGEARAARINGRTIRLFPQAEGGSLGLMPVPAGERPGEYSLEFLDGNGAALHTVAITVVDARFPSQDIRISRTILQLKPAPGELETVAEFRRGMSEVRYWKDPLMSPLRGCMTSPFGVRRLHNGRATGRYHDGVDQRSPSGTPVRAVAAGAVRIVRQFDLHGGTVAIDHGQGLESIYLHMSKFAVSEGAIVHQGDVIGYVGSTGRSTAPHLHWSLYANGVPVNPRQWVELQPCLADDRGHRRRRGSAAQRRTARERSVGVGKPGAASAGH